MVPILGYSNIVISLQEMIGMIDANDTGIATTADGHDLQTTGAIDVTVM